MAIEEGVVIRAGRQNPLTAWVKTVQSSACESCASRDSCNPGSKGNEREVEALNTVNAKVGDRIQISIDTRALLKATFLLYVFPIICMLIGGIMGHTAGLKMGFENPSPMSAIVAVVCFLGAMLLVRLRAGRMALKNEYRPKITRILGRTETTPNPSGPPSGCESRVTGNV